MIDVKKLLFIAIICLPLMYYNSTEAQKCRSIWQRSVVFDNSHNIEGFTLYLHYP